MLETLDEHLDQDTTGPRLRRTDLYQPDDDFYSGTEADTDEENARRNDFSISMIDFHGPK
jgi:hypothetical protein